MKILIGDDSLTQRVMLEAIVSKWGFDAVLAEDGQQAWDILSAADAPRLVLLDWEMPGIDGLEVCRRARARQDRDPPYILLLTARSETADIVAGLDAGANDYIQKPFENNELHARLRVGARMLDLQRALIDAREALEFQASHDDLTGLLNRGAIMQAAEQAVERTRRSGRPLQVGLLDIDHFKQINDTHGHPVGDAVLREAAERIHSTLRSGDLVGRYGGEEFLLLVNGEMTDAPAFCERLRGAIADRPFEPGEVALRVTLSGGFVAVDPRDDGSVADILAAADKFLYQAKTGGRNRILFDQPAGAATPAKKRSAG
ncbi:MAG: diguanylate cyclase [Gammaproteobacteria bacterium]|nr:diguanylate cyclase [Gammaproteobacteria bacterium]